MTTHIYTKAEYEDGKLTITVENIFHSDAITIINFLKQLLDLMAAEVPGSFEIKKQ